MGRERDIQTDNLTLSIRLEIEIEKVRAHLSECVLNTYFFLSLYLYWINSAAN